MDPKEINFEIFDRIHVTYLVHIHALISLYHINTETRTRILLFIYI